MQIFKAGLALLAAGLVLGLTACSDPQTIVAPTSNPAFTDLRQRIDEAVDATTDLQPVRMGAYLSPVEGKYFRPLQPLDSRNAIVYVYRPHSKWNAEELQAPGFFLNGVFLYGLKDSGYFWFEVPAGTYVLTGKRPLTVIYLKTIFETNITVEGGKNYYFRYDEENRIAKPADHPELVQAGPLLQMPDDRGLRQVEGTVLEEQGVTYGMDYQPAWAPFELYPKPLQVNPARIEVDKTPAATGHPADLNRDHRVWWNPLTWDADD